MMIFPSTFLSPTNYRHAIRQDEQASIQSSSSLYLPLPSLNLCANMCKYYCHISMFSELYKYINMYIVSFIFNTYCASLKQFADVIYCFKQENLV